MVREGDRMFLMKQLIVNADDFGLSKGVNRGIIESHLKGIVTSTSLMVDGIAADEAKNLLQYPNLSVGLHFNITDEGLKADIIKRVILPLSKVDKVRNEFERQFEKFIKIVGYLPDHLDSHHQIHLHKKVRSIFEEYSQKYKIPVRSFSNVNFIDTFFGWNFLRQKELKKISTEALLTVLSNIKEGFNELMCHPGYVDKTLKSSYSEEREIEIKALTSEKVIEYIKENKIELINWKKMKVSSNIIPGV